MSKKFPRCFACGAVCFKEGLPFVETPQGPMHVFDQDGSFWMNDDKNNYPCFALEGKLVIAAKVIW
jgi:hypothetical protein